MFVSKTESVCINDPRTAQFQSFDQETDSILICVSR